MGWITVAAYAAAALLCILTALRSRERDTGPAWFWWAVAALMLGLAINKQLDLQSWFTQTAKDMAIEQGWYERRRTFQFAFVLAVAAAGLLGSLALAWVLRRSWRRTGLAVAGLFAVVSYVVIRASSFHHLDELIRWSPGGIRMNWVFELGGIAMLCVGAWLARSGPPRPPVEDASSGS